MSHMLPQSSY